jgi:hypothetical protein
MLASVAGIAGSMGQSNYAAGNTYQDGLARYRLSHGEKAVSIDLGWMGDVGIIAENAYLTKGKEDAGDLAQIYEAEFLALLDRYCDPGWEIKAAQDAQPIIGLVTPAQFRSRGIEVPEWVLERPLLRGLARFQSVDEVDQMNTNAYDTGADNDADWAAKFLVSTSGTEATNIITEALIQKLSRATSVEPGTISRIRPLHAYGVDSLLAVELRNWFSKVFRADVAIFDITGPMSIEQVAEDAASKSELLRKWN